MMERNSPIYFTCYPLFCLCGVLVVLLSSPAGFAQSAGTQPAEKDGVKGGEGQIKFDITDIIGRPLASRGVVELSGGAGQMVLEMPEGVGTLQAPLGPARVKVYVYDDGVPVLVDINDIAVEAGAPSFVLVTLLEGSKESGPLRRYDQDFDLALDSFELAYGTDPLDPASIPGEESFVWKSETLKAEPGWYRGELHSSSLYGRGQESVAELVKRAEKLGLDFLAITDRNTLDSALDPDFVSDKVVLIPAMEWGDDARGVALIYGPRTLVPLTDNVSEGQAMLVRVQAQGGIVAIAHPCFPTNPWLWGFSHMNAVEGWCRDWGKAPPMTLGHLDARNLERKDGKLMHSIAVAAATRGKSANGQAVLFWDLETNQGLQAGIIAGSRTSHPKVAMATPITYVYANEKSLRGILEGLRQGRTFVSSGPDGPRVDFIADVFDDGLNYVSIGGVIPINQETRFYVTVRGAKGKRLEVLYNGLPNRIFSIKEDEAVYNFVDFPSALGSYRVRVVDTPTSASFELVEMHAMTSAIYAREVVIVDPTGKAAWIPLKSEFIRPEILDEHIRKFGDPADSELELGVKLITRDP